MDLLSSGNDGTLKKSHRLIQGGIQSGRLLGREAYLDWGARAKILDLEKRHPLFLVDGPEDPK